MTAQQAFDLALQLHQAGRLEEAVAFYRHVVAVQPKSALVQVNLAGALAALRRYDEALASARRAVELDQGNAGAHLNLGIALTAQGEANAAEPAYRLALQLQPDFPEAHNNLGVLLAGRRDFAAAAACYREALRRKDEYPECWNNLGTALAEQGHVEEALAAFRKAIRFKPDYAKAFLNLGKALHDHGHTDEAIEAWSRALELQPDFVEARHGLANAFKDQGQLDRSIAEYRRALDVQPGNAGLHSNLILALHYQPSVTAGEIVAEQQRWNDRFIGSAWRQQTPPEKARDPNRRLHIGYLSADFRDHAVGRSLRPLFANLDQEGFETICYSGAAREDHLTAEFRQRANRWRSTVGTTDSELARMIREGEVDILVDLSQHTAGNRLPVFGHRPAPVQVSFGGYPESTGVEAIEYRISDRWLGDFRLPIGDCRLCPASERRRETVYLLDSFWCFDPCSAEVAVNEAPVERNGYVTFGCLNNFCKINRPLLRVWGRVLRELQNSRLVILSMVGSQRQRATECLTGEGINAGRVEFVEPRPRHEYLSLYHRVDAILDTFPYNGHTTSLDALWMGVPVVSLAGESAVSRAGLSQLSNVGLTDLVAYSEEDYVQIAAKLARDLGRLGELRRTLRQRMEMSVLMDGPRFARQIEETYRAMWDAWCAA